MGTLVYKSFDFYFQEPSKLPSLKTAGFQARHQQVSGVWRYAHVCSRLALSDSLPEISQVLPGTITIASNGALSFDRLHQLRMFFDFEKGYQSEVTATSGSNESFEKLFLLSSGKLEFYRLSVTENGRAVFELRSAADEDRRRIQMAIRFVLFEPGEPIPDSALLTP
jgi:hypothetical protein